MDGFNIRLLHNEELRMDRGLSRYDREAVREEYYRSLDNRDKQARNSENRSYWNDRANIIRTYLDARKGR